MLCADCWHFTSVFSPNLCTLCFEKKKKVGGTAWVPVLYFPHLWLRVIYAPEFTVYLQLSNIIVILALANKILRILTQSSLRHIFDDPFVCRKTERNIDRERFMLERPVCLPFQRFAYKSEHSKWACVWTVWVCVCEWLWILACFWQDTLDSFLPSSEWQYKKLSC